MCVAGDCATYEARLSLDLRAEHLKLAPGQWQPCTQASPDSRWLLLGRRALDSKTMAFTMLASEEEIQSRDEVEQMESRERVEWAVWCADGLHALMLVTPDVHRQAQQMRVWHVTSGTLTASLGCCRIPTVFRTVDSEEPCPMDMYVSCKRQTVLIPESLAAVSLCKFPGLARVAQFDSPVVGGEAATLVSLGWAHHGCLIVMVWEARQD